MTLRSTFVNFLPKGLLSKRLLSKNLLSRFKESDKTEDIKKPSTDTIDTTSIKSMAGILGVADSNPDEILKKQGVKIYDEMEAKDTHVYSVYQTRKLAIAMTPWDIYPGEDNDRAREIADFIFTAIDDCKGTFAEDIKQLLDAIGKGFSILEIVWKLVEKGRWKGKYTVDELLFHKQKYWFFKDKRWHKSDESVILFGDSAMRGVPVPWEKIIHFAYDAEDNLYGRAAFKPCYYFYWFKKEGWKSWIIFLNKYGTPTAVGKYPKSAKPSEQTKLLDIVETIQEETGVIVPDGMDLSFLEASHAGPASYRELADACNAEISKAILGATQTVEEGRRGSYALSRAHSEVRRERVEADVVEISDVIQQQLVKRLVDFNFITDVYPQFIMKTFAGRDTEVTRKKAPIAKIPEKVPVIVPEEPVEIIPEKTPEELIGAPVIPEKIPEEKIIPEKSEVTAESEVIAEPEVTIELKKTFERVKNSVLKNYERKQSPEPINVGPIKKILKDKFDDKKAFRLAKKIKAYIEIRIKPENVEEIFEEALEQLREELKK